MAFFRRAGNILGRVASSHVSREICSSEPSMFQAIRSMSSSKPFVGGLGRTRVNTVVESVRMRSAYQGASPIAQDLSFQLRTKKAGSLRAIFSRMVNNIPLSMKKRVTGIRVCLSGRIRGAKIARSEVAKYGKISRNVFDQKMDYALAEVSTRYGILGVKVWISYRQKRKTPALYGTDA